MLSLVTNLVNGHFKRFSSRRQTPEHQASEPNWRFLGEVEVMLQKQWVKILAHDQVDGHRGFIQGRFALKVPTLPPFL